MSFDQILLNYGPEGLIVVVLSTVIVYLWRDNKSLQAALTTLADNRLQDAKDFGKRTEELSGKTITTVGQLNELFRRSDREA